MSLGHPEASGMAASGYLFTPAEIAVELRVTLRTVYSWLESGKLPAVKVGSQWRVDGEGLERFFDRRGSRFDLAAWAARAEERRRQKPRIPAPKRRNEAAIALLDRLYHESSTEDGVEPPSVPALALRGVDIG
jgi:excisionase family DNA binding protein